MTLLVRSGLAIEVIAEDSSYAEIVGFQIEARPEVGEAGPGVQRAQPDTHPLNGPARRTEPS